MIFFFAEVYNLRTLKISMRTIFSWSWAQSPFIIKFNPSILKMVFMQLRVFNCEKKKPERKTVPFKRFTYIAASKCSVKLPISE